MAMGYEKKLFTCFLGVILFVSFNSPANAIWDKKKKQSTPQTVTTEKNTTNTKTVKSINLESVLEKAIQNSYDLQLADFDILIAKYGINLARAEYLPKIGLSVGTEYNKNFKDQNTTSISVGDTFINPYTRFQTIGGVTLAYNLYDFGVRRSYLDMAKEDTQLKKYLKIEQNQELSLTVIDLYSRILIVSEQLKIKKDILAIEEKSLGMRKRLYKAGEISKTELNDQVARIEQVKKEIEVLNGLLDENLIGLTFFTNENYDSKNIKVADVTLPDYNISQGFDYSKSIATLIHDTVIRRKKYELTATKRTNYPKVNLYTKYYMYGSDPTDYGRSISDFSASNWALGASVNMTPFDGGKNRSKVKQVEIEIKKVQVEKEKALAELKRKINVLKSNYEFNNKQLDHSNVIVKELNEKEISTAKLLKNKLVSPIDLQDTEVKLLEEKIENLKLKTTSVAILKSVQILTTTY